MRTSSVVVFFMVLSAMQVLSYPTYGLYRRPIYALKTFSAAEEEPKPSTFGQEEPNASNPTVPDAIEPQPVPEAEKETSVAADVRSCGSDSDLAVVESVVFDPENPKAGKELTITTVSLFKETLQPGAYLKVTAKLGPIPVRTEQYNLCDFVECPAAAGYHTYSMKVAIPEGTPKIKLTYRSEGFTVDGRRLNCVQGFFSIQ